MVVAVKIKNRETNEYMKKGGGWNKKGKSWSCLKDAKLAICPNYGYSEKELDSDFITFDENGTVEVIPVAVYFLDYFTREARDSFYRRPKALNEIEKIKKYCEENNIDLGEAHE